MRNGSRVGIPGKPWRSGSATHAIVVISDTRQCQDSIQQKQGARSEEQRQSPAGVVTARRSRTSSARDHRGFYFFVCNSLRALGISSAGRRRWQKRISPGDNFSVFEKFSRLILRCLTSQPNHTACSFCNRSGGIGAAHAGTNPARTNRVHRELW